MSEEEESISSARLPYTVRNLSNMTDDDTDTSTEEEDSLLSLPPSPRRISSRTSASPYRTADRVAASQRLQLAQRSTRPRLGTIREECKRSNQEQEVQVSQNEIETFNHLLFCRMQQRLSYPTLMKGLLHHQLYVLYAVTKFPFKINTIYHASIHFTRNVLIVKGRRQ